MRESLGKRQQVMEDYGLTEEDMTGVEIDPETGQSIVERDELKEASIK